MGLYDRMEQPSDSDLWIDDIKYPTEEFVDSYYGFGVDQFLNTNMYNLNLAKFNDIQRFITRMKKSCKYYCNVDIIAGIDISTESGESPIDIIGEIQMFTIKLIYCYNAIARNWNMRHETDIMIYTDKTKCELKEIAKHILDQIEDIPQSEILEEIQLSPWDMYQLNMLTQLDKKMEE
jgi:hypothetical protein